MQSSYYIFGAHSRGQTTSVYLKALYPERKFLGFLYANEEKNPDCIDGNPVIKLREGLEGLDLKAAVYIATRGIYHNDISKGLEKMGFKEIIPVDMDLDIELRNKFIPDYFGKQGRDFTRLDNISGIVGGAENKAIVRENAPIYVVRSAVDSPLSKDVPLCSCEKYIQAGSGLTDSRIEGCNIFDNTGDNISDKNRKMCELTAMYWIWKNAKEDVVGIEHYRRRFILPDGWENVIRSGAVDVILPVPLFVNPNVRENYCGRHTSFTWDAMMEVLSEMYPEYVEEAKQVFEKSGCYCPCNMLIARKEIFDEMCSWLFPILFTVMERCGIIDDKYQNRYPGFLAERLITLFFHFNESRYNIVYADKAFLG
jgi:hypothetical protein